MVEMAWHRLEQPKATTMGTDHDSGRTRGAHQIVFAALQTLVQASVFVDLVRLFGLVNVWRGVDFIIRCVLNAVQSMCSFSLFLELHLCSGCVGEKKETGNRNILLLEEEINLIAPPLCTENNSLNGWSRVL